MACGIRLGDLADHLPPRAGPPGDATRLLSFCQYVPGLPKTMSPSLRRSMRLLIQDGLPEFLHYGCIGFAVRQQNLVAQFVGFDEMAAQIAQGVADEGLAAGEAACESYLEHFSGPAERRLQAGLPAPLFSIGGLRPTATVLDISMAMVKGPTPPGTGV